MSGVGEAVIKKVQDLTKEASNKDLEIVIEALQDQLITRANKKTSS